MNFPLNALAQYVLLVSSMLAVASCSVYRVTASDWGWQDYRGFPSGQVLLPDGTFALPFIKCEREFLSNSQCTTALGSKAGEKQPVEHVTAALWRALKKYPGYADWPPIPSGKARTAPFRLVWVSLEPTIVIIAPSPPNSTGGRECRFDMKSPPPPCVDLPFDITNRVLLGGAIQFAEGTLWFSPEFEGRGLVPIPVGTDRYTFPIGQNLFLQRDGKFWKFGRGRS